MWWAGPLSVIGTAVYEAKDGWLPNTEMSGTGVVSHCTAPNTNSIKNAQYKSS